MPGTATTDKHGNLQPSGLIDIAAVASRLGVSVRHVRRLVQERRITFIKWGHLIRFDPADLEEWVEAARITTGQQPRIR